jgi:integrase
MPRKVNLRWEAKSNAWRADVGFYGTNGRRKTKYFRELPPTAKGKRLAEEACEAWIIERDRLEARARIEASDPTLYEGLIKPFLYGLAARVEAGELENRTVQAYYERLLRLLEFTPSDGPNAGIAMVDRRLSTITDDDGQAWLDAMRTEGLSATRIVGVLGAAKTMFGWAARNVAGRNPKRILPANPFEGLKAPSVSKGRRELPTVQETARFFQAARREVEPFKREGCRCMGCKRSHRPGPCRRSHTTRAIHHRVLLVLLRLQIHAGTRPSELCRATWGPTERHPDIGWNPRAWEDPDTGHWWGMLVVWGKTTRATGRLRRIAVPPALARAIERIRAQQLHPTYVFPRLARGGSGRWTVEGIDRHVRRWRDGAGIGGHFVPYGFRHRMYTRAIHAGGLTTDQAGAVGGTAGPTVASTYLQPTNADVFEHASIIHQAVRERRPFSSPGSAIR